MITEHEAFLFFIEPVLPPSEQPVIDVYTRKLTGALRCATHGGSGYGQNIPIFCPDTATRGWHSCSCGNGHSTNVDYLLRTKEAVYVSIYKNNRDFFAGNNNNEPIQGVITNSLAVHYIAFHREEVPSEMLERILSLEGEEVNPTEENLKGNL